MKRKHRLFQFTLSIMVLLFISGCVGTNTTDNPLKASSTNSQSGVMEEVNTSLPGTSATSSDDTVPESTDTSASEETSTADKSEVIPYRDSRKVTNLSLLRWGYEYVAREGETPEQMALLLEEGLLFNLTTSYRWYSLVDYCSFTLVGYEQPAPSPVVYYAKDGTDPDLPVADFPDYLNENCWLVWIDVPVKFTGSYDGILASEYGYDDLESDMFFTGFQEAFIMERDGDTYRLFSRQFYEERILGGDPARARSHVVDIVYDYAGYTGVIPYDASQKVGTLSGLRWGYEYTDTEGKTVEEVAALLREALLNDLMQDDGRCTFTILAYEELLYAPTIFTADDNPGLETDFPKYLNENCWLVWIGALIKYTGGYSVFGNGELRGYANLDDDMWFNEFLEEFILERDRDTYRLFSRQYYEERVLAGDAEAREHVVVVGQAEAGKAD